jgi:hypothetical protein
MLVTVTETEANDPTLHRDGSERLVMINGIFAEG